MSVNSQETESLVTAKGIVFGAELKRAIKAEFGTSKVFAKLLGVTEGRVSQIVKGSEPLTASTLDLILGPFQDVGVQDQLHRAWVRSFAPEPIESLTSLETAIQCERLLNSIRTLIESGRSRHTLGHLLSLRNQIVDKDTWFRLTRASIDLTLRLERPHLAMKLAREVIRTSHGQNEPIWEAHGLWTLASASRIATAFPLKNLALAHEESIQFVSEWSPNSINGKAAKRGLVEAVTRDQALAVLAINSRKPVPEVALQHQLTSLEALVSSASDEIGKAIAFEVMARVCVAAGELFQAEELLDESRLHDGYVSADHGVKAAILDGQIQIKRGEQEVGLDTLERAQDQALESDNLHHVQVIERLLIDHSSK